MNKIGKHMSEWFDAGLLACRGLFTAVLLLFDSTYEILLKRIHVVN
jgi:hypothetical protein